MRNLLRDPEGELPVRSRSLVFGLTWLAYAAYYLGRKGFAVTKARIADEQGLSLRTLGQIDTGYLSAYAIGQLLSGLAGDRLGTRRLVGLGMLVSAAACLLFGTGSGAWVLGVAFALNGCAQATGWPGTVKAMAQWFRGPERGALMGLWTTNYQVGGLAATALATALLARWGWRAAFTVPAAVLALIGCLVLVVLPEREETAARVAAGSVALVRSRDILRMPAVWSIGVAYFGLKLIRYSILFWLPFYLRKELGYSESAAGYLSVSFEVGGIAGAIVVGLISDRLFRERRRVLASRMIALLGVALLLYTRLATLGPVANFAGMALVGFCLFGPDALISGAAAQDVGGPAAAATAAGLINGIGSVGAILQGWVTVGVSEAWGWGALFYLFVALAMASALTLRLLGESPPPLATSR
jgi:sugar phosphate permease